MGEIYVSMVMILSKFCVDAIKKFSNSVGTCSFNVWVPSVLIRSNSDFQIYEYLYRKFISKTKFPNRNLKKIVSNTYIFTESYNFSAMSLSQMTEYDNIEHKNIPKTTIATNQQNKKRNLRKPTSHCCDSQHLHLQGGLPRCANSNHESRP